MKNLVMSAVESSNLAKVGYCADTKLMAVSFKNNTTYLYLDVPQETFDSIVKAESVGKAFNAVKNNFKYTKLEV